MRRSLSANLMLSTALTLALGMLVVFGVWSLIARYEPTWLRDGDLRGVARHVDKGLSFDSAGRPTAVRLPHNLQQVVAALPADFFFQILDQRGNVLISSNGTVVAALPVGVEPSSAVGISDSVQSGLPAHVIVVPVSRSRSKGAFFVLASRSDRFDETLVENEAANIRATALIGSVAAIAVFSMVVFVTMSGMLKRLRNLSAAASKIDHVNLRARLAAEDVPRELKPLIESFNQALERLEAGFRIQQEFLATAAHELKTPLALVRGEIELRGATNRTRILSDLDHMDRQVHQLLHLAEVSDASNLALASVDPCAVAHDAVTFIERLSRPKNIDIRIECLDPPLQVMADAGALFVLVRNLVENAVHHSPMFSTIVVAIDEGSIAVRDEGRGIADADFPMLFKRFWRGSHRRDDGAGLGLSICSEVARGHGWKLTAANRAPTGAEFRLWFSTGANLLE